MTEAEANFVNLDRKYADVKKYFDARSEAMQKVVDESGIGHTFQDDQGIVYHTVIPEWKQVKMDHIDILHSRREGEAKGTLSEKRAAELTA